VSRGAVREAQGDDAYVPAAGRSALTGIYDTAIALTMRERRFRGELVDRVLHTADGQGIHSRAPDVLDLGAGTGTLAIMLAAHGARVEAVDGDPEVLALARAKAGAEHVRWHEARVDALPLEDASVDRVVCSLVLHHLPDHLKHAALGESWRVLRQGGQLHVADWGPPRDPAMRIAFRLLQAVDGRERTQSHADGLIPGFIADAGFGAVTVGEHLRTMWGQLELISAIKESG
jgi:SAM-dependent methyltransferase